MIFNYTDIVSYISKNGTKDEMGYTIENIEEKHVRYVGGAEVQVETNNGFGTEHRLIYFCPFKVDNGDHFIINNNRMEVKNTEEIRDIFNKTIHWRVELK